jgi:rhamnogalacturonan endolyase
MTERTHNTLAAFAALLFLAIGPAWAQRQMEALGRGLVAIHEGDGNVFVGWRLLGNDPPEIAFNLYRTDDTGKSVKLNDRPIADATFHRDRGVDLTHAQSYSVRPVLAGAEGEPSVPFTLPAAPPARPYLEIPLQTPDGYTPNDVSVGDLDGDGEYEIVLHQVGSGRDNSQGGFTTSPILEAYKLDGTLLWRIDLGYNIREGAHYTQFMVYDLDGDGRAEVACKTADGTVDGMGFGIGDPKADWLNEDGFIVTGPEFLTVFDGMTGMQMATTDYIPPRHPTKLKPTPDEVSAIWGDGNGNRVDRFLACVAYLDGERPSLVMCRGYYTRTVLAAWDWRDGRLTHRWTFDSDAGNPDDRRFRGQGNHGLAVGDVDGDGRDEIVYGSMVIDDDGTGLYSIGLGHGDALHLSDLIPDRPGLEIFDIHENARHEHGVEMRDARTGEILWSKPSEDVGRGLAIDVDPRHPGYESWASGPGLSGVWNVKGEEVSWGKPRSCNFGVMWDGDTLSEILDSNRITKWDYITESEIELLRADGCQSNNGTKSTPALCADILGDWREEVIWRTNEGNALRIYTTTVPTDRRFYTLMHDPIYRLSIAWQNVAYNQPPHTGFYMGWGMPDPPRPRIRVAPFAAR